VRVLDLVLGMLQEVRGAGGGLKLDIPKQNSFKRACILFQSWAKYMTIILRHAEAVVEIAAGFQDFE
jgi:hypothetical protein